MRRKIMATTLQSKTLVHKSLIYCNCLFLWYLDVTIPTHKPGNHKTIVVTNDVTKTSEIVHKTLSKVKILKWLQVWSF